MTYTPPEPARLITIEYAVRQVKATVDTLEAAVNQLPAGGTVDLSPVTSQLATIASQLTNLQTAVAGLGSPTVDLSGIASQLTNLQTAVAGLGSPTVDLSGITTQLTNLQTAVAVLGPPSGAVAPTAFGQVYTCSQSTVWSDTYYQAPGSYQNLTDQALSSGAGTLDQGTQWIQASFQWPVVVRRITVAGGTLSGFGPVASFLNGSKLQYSNDRANWSEALSITGCNDGGFTSFTLSTPITAQYWRLYRNDGNNLGTTELRFF